MKDSFPVSLVPLVGLCDWTIIVCIRGQLPKLLSSPIPTHLTPSQLQCSGPEATVAERHHAAFHYQSRDSIGWQARTN